MAANLKTVHKQLTTGLNELRRITKQIRGSDGEVGDPTLAHRDSKHNRVITSYGGGHVFDRPEGDRPTT